MGFIGHASIDENGKITGGQTGDQTGREIRIQEWYSKPWNKFLYCTDKLLAATAAGYMKRICECDNFGYSQGKRWDGHNSIVANGKNVEVSKGDYDCSSLILSCYILAGLNIKPTGYTGNMASILLSTGKFECYTDKEHLQSDKFARVGSIYLKEGSHVVMSLSDNTQTPEAVDPPATSATENLLKSAQSFNKSIAGLYTATTAVNMRYGPGTSNSIITTVPKGETVRSFGYYTKVSGTDWYLVRFGTKDGFISSKFLK